MGVTKAERLGATIRDLRYRSGLTQAQLAYRAGVGEKTLKRLEAGKTDTPRPETMAAVAGALGMSPRELFSAVEEPDASEEAAPPPPAIHQLPRPPQNFTGRVRELAELEAHLQAHLAGEGATISAIHGMGGMGKTTLALVVAERWAERFPDGQFYLDLRGTTEPVGAADAMMHVIRSIDPGRPPPNTEAEVEAAYRTVLRGKRTLLLMDNAVGREQVAPLVPPEGSLLLVTSRQRFALPGLRAVALSPLEVDDSRALLGTLAPRADAVGGELAGLCGGLPLALSLAGRALAERPDLDPGEYAARLADDRSRLAQLDAGESSDGVQASFELSFEMLDDALRACLCNLAVFPHDFDRSGVAAVWGVSEEEADARIGKLLRFNLLEWDGAGQAARYRLHDLVRLFADTRLREAPRRAAMLSHGRHYLALLERSEARARAGEQRAALVDVDREWPNIQAAFVHCRALAELAGPDSEPAELLSTAPDAQVVLRLRQDARERAAWCELAAKVAEARGQRSLQGRLLAHSARAHLESGDPRAAAGCSARALLVLRDAGEPRSEAYAFVGAADAYHALGQPHAAIEHARRALSLAREHGARSEEAGALVVLGWGYHVLGEPERALVFAKQAYPIAQELSDRTLQGMTLLALGFSHQATGQWDKGNEYGRRCLQIARELGDRRMEGFALLTSEPLATARDAYAQALEIAREIGELRMEGNALFMTGLSCSMLGDMPAAIEALEPALNMAEETGDLAMKLNSLTALGIAYTTTGQLERAIERLRKGVASAAEVGNQRQEALAGLLLGSALEVAGRLQEALHQLEKSLALQEETSYPAVDNTRKRIAALRARIEAEG